MIVKSISELKDLVASDDYLFHGSPNGNIDVLEPRQAKISGNPDGEPAVIAAESIEAPIFMAILGSKKMRGCGWGSKDSITPNNPHGFYVHKDDYLRAEKENWSGYVYVLPRAEFQRYANWEWRAHKNVKPLSVLRVEFKDLPKDIDLRTKPQS